ncbi:MAG: autoinducer binding domain-containing protein [Pseudomonadota bacterium]
MQRHYAQIEALSDLGEILRTVIRVCEAQGVIRQSYHFTPQFDAANSPETMIYARGYDREWLDRYDEADFRLSDPIPERTMQHGALLTWKEAQRQGPNTSANDAFFEALREAGFIHGFGLPLYGPRGRNAYASFDFGVPIEEIGSVEMGIVRAVPQAAHQRVCVLLDAMEAAPDLSEREREVLQWIARGKSIATIAAILELSPDTVKTYSKRVYAKLGTSDRVGATVKALKLGLVNV